MEKFGIREIRRKRVLTDDSGALTDDGGVLTGNSGALTDDGGVLTGNSGALTDDGRGITCDGKVLINGW